MSESKPHSLAKQRSAHVSPQKSDPVDFRHHIDAIQLCYHDGERLVDIELIDHPDAVVQFPIFDNPNFGRYTGRRVQGMIAESDNLKAILGKDAEEWRGYALRLAAVHFPFTDENATDGGFSKILDSAYLSLKDGLPCIDIAFKSYPSVHATFDVVEYKGKDTSWNGTLSRRLVVNGPEADQKKLNELLKTHRAAWTTYLETLLSLHFGR